MTIDVYMQIEGINGESMDDKHRGWIEVSHVIWNVNQSRASTVSTAGGHSCGRAELSEITFRKMADLASPLLLQSCATGKTIPKARFEFMRADGNGVPITYFRRLGCRGEQDRRVRRSYDEGDCLSRRLEHAAGDL